MICFLFAMEKEAAPLLEDSEILESTLTGFARFYVCEKNEKKFLVGITGIGKVFAASALTSLRIKFPTVTGIYNVGVGGSLDAKKAPLLSLVAGKQYVCHDIDTTALGDPLGMVSGIEKIYFDADKDLLAILKKAAEEAGIQYNEGIIASGDRFIAEKKERDLLAEKFTSLSCDMESAAMAQISYVYQIPFCAARLVSDTGETPNEYIENVAEASRLAKKIIDNLLLAI